MIDEPLAELSPGDRLRNWIDTVPDRLLVARPATWVMWTLIATLTSPTSPTARSTCTTGLAPRPTTPGLYDQGVWLMSRFEAPFVTLMGRNLMGDHSSFILAGLVPLYWVAPGAWILFFLQSVGDVGAAALPVYLYAPPPGSSRDWLAVLFGSGVSPPSASRGRTCRTSIPTRSSGCSSPSPCTARSSASGRADWIGVVLALLVKEDVVLVMAPLGLWVALKRDVRKGVLTIAAGVWAAVFADVRGDAIADRRADPRTPGASRSAACAA